MDILSKNTSFSIAALLPIIFGCTGEEIDAGFSISWALDSLDGVEISCAEAGGQIVEIEVLDSEKTKHLFRAPCEDGRYETARWSMATGPGSLGMRLLSEHGEMISELQRISFDFKSGQLRNDLGLVRFATDVEAPLPEGPKITWYWKLADGAGNQVSCDRVGASFLGFSIADSEGSLHELGVAPCRTASVHNGRTSRPVAPGRAEYLIELLNREKMKVGRFETEIVIPEKEGEFEIGVVTIEVTPFLVGGDAGITWEWRNGAEYFMEESCEAAGIDYAKLWIWREPLSEWWTDGWTLSAPCRSFDHQADFAVWADEPYSGLFVDRLLEPGDYRMLLGFYRYAGDESPADVLLYYDEREAEEGHLLSNDLSDRGTNLFTTVVEPDELPKTGALEIGLEWSSSSDGDTLSACESAGISEMGFALMSGDILVSELEPGTAAPCRDRLDFDVVPILDEPYDLIISGVSFASGTSYYSICSGMTPEPDEAPRESKGYICRVSP